MQTTQKSSSPDSCAPISAHPQYTQPIQCQPSSVCLPALWEWSNKVQPVDNSDNTALLQNLYFLLLLFSMCSVRIIIYD